MTMIWTILPCPTHCKTFGGGVNSLGVDMEANILMSFISLGEATDFRVIDPVLQITWT